MTLILTPEMAAISGLDPSDVGISPSSVPTLKHWFKLREYNASDGIIRDSVGDIVHPPDLITTRPDFKGIELQDSPSTQSGDSLGYTFSNSGDAHTFNADSNCIAVLIVCRPTTIGVDTGINGTQNLRWAFGKTADGQGIGMSNFGSFHAVTRGTYIGTTGTGTGTSEIGAIFNDTDIFMEYTTYPNGGSSYAKMTAETVQTSLPDLTDGSFSIATASNYASPQAYTVGTVKPQYSDGRCCFRFSGGVFYEAMYFEFTTGAIPADWLQACRWMSYYAARGVRAIWPGAVDWT